MFYRLLSVAACLVTSSVLSQERAVPAEALSAALREDTRLLRPISVSDRRIYLGELLDRISAATGARVEVSDRAGPFSGYELAVSLHDCPSREVMEAVRRLYTTPADRWYWTRERRQGQERYLLKSTQPVGAAHLAWKSFIENYILEDRRRLDQFVVLGPEQRAALARNSRYYRAMNQQFDRTRGFQSFVTPLSDVEIQSVIRGRPLVIPMSRLSAAQREFIQSEFRLARQLDKPGVKQPHEMESVRLICDGTGKSTVFLDLGPVGAHGVLGGVGSMEAVDARRKRAERAWSAVTEKLREALPRGKAVQLLYDRAPVPRVRNLESRLPRSLETLRTDEAKSVVWKRWENIYLFRPREEEEFDRREWTPWPLIRDLRRAAVMQEGYLRPQDWLRLAALAPEQLRRLSSAGEFRDAARVRQFQDVLRLYSTMSSREREQAARDDGAGWNDLKTPTRTRLIQLVGAQAARTVRVIVKWNSQVRPPTVRISRGLDRKGVFDVQFLTRQTPKD